MRNPSVVRATLLLGLLALVAMPRVAHAEPQFPLKAKRILVLGDSITHAGHYVAWIQTQLRLQGVDPLPQIINIGLASETCSGLSEPDHPFPRPDVHERLDRALAAVKPDVVVACYGMNDGIYYPFSDERFKAYQDGVNKLIEKVHAAGAKLVLMAPTPFDPVPLEGKGKLKPDGEAKYSYMQMYEKYDDVLSRYGKWIMQQRDRVEMVIDLHTPIAEALAEHRKTDPKYSFSGDGIHPNVDGHRIMGDTILHAWGVESITEPSDELLKLMTQRQSILHDAWLTAVGHKRPGVKAGLPLDEAEAKAAELEAKAKPLIEADRGPHDSTHPSADGTVYQVHYPGMTADGELSLAVDYYLWVPSGAKKLRGVIVHQHGCGPGASLGGRTAADDLHWQALARKWDCALMGSSYDPRKGANCRLWCDPRNGSDARFLQSLAHFADVTGHAEVDDVPWCLWGHSGGGFWASLMQVAHPQRIVAIWYQSGTAYGYWMKGDIPTPIIPEAAYGVPAMANPGLKEKTDKRFHVGWEGITAMREDYLEHGAFFEFAPDPRTSHETGDSRYLSIPFFDFWLDHRLPAADAPDAAALQPIDEGRRDWPKAMAAKLDEFVRTGAVGDTTPPPAPRAVHASRDAATGQVTITWDAFADFESGVQCFVIERGGQKIGQVPEKPVGRFGRPLFQQMSYHDTPEAPLPSMSFVDKEAPAGGTPIYGVRTVNSVGLSSDPTTDH